MQDDDENYLSPNATDDDDGVQRKLFYSDSQPSGNEEDDEDDEDQLDGLNASAKRAHRTCMRHLTEHY